MEPFHVTNCDDSDLEEHYKDNAPPPHGSEVVERASDSSDEDSFDLYCKIWKRAVESSFETTLKANEGHSDQEELKPKKEEEEIKTPRAYEPQPQTRDSECDADSSETPQHIRRANQPPGGPGLGSDGKKDNTNIGSGYSMPSRPGRGGHRGYPYHARRH